VSALEALRSWRYAKAQPTVAVRRVQSGTLQSRHRQRGVAVAVRGGTLPRRILGTVAPATAARGVSSGRYAGQFWKSQPSVSWPEENWATRLDS
jgi:hypothetical protein